MFIGDDYEGHPSHIGRKCVFNHNPSIIGGYIKGLGMIWAIFCLPSNLSKIALFLFLII